MALREAALPENCSRTIYMCDDGKDPLKRDWVDSLGPGVIYVSGERECPSSQMLAAPTLRCILSMHSAQLLPRQSR